MTHLDIICAWKDEEYRLSLSEAERALLPPNPAGLIELTDAELAHAAGTYEPGTYPIPEPGSIVHPDCKEPPPPPEPPHPDTPCCDPFSCAYACGSV
jgi:mersacidin/lichenicidin family type 2 lantibiotic